MSRVSDANECWTFERLTGIQRSAVAVWKLRGVTDPIPAELQDLGIPGRLHDRIRLVAFGPPPSEDCVCVRTGSASVELQTHGGRAVAERVVDLLSGAGGQPFTELDFDDECWHAVSEAKTKYVAKRLAALADGDLSATLRGFMRSPSAEAIVGLNRLIEATVAAEPMIQGAKITIAGRPNAGKSSLLNRIVGFERSLTDPRPGATRDVVSIGSAVGGYPVTLSDTAGLRDATDEIEREGVRRAEANADDADLILLVIDQSEVADDEVLALIERFPRAITVAHKCDQPDKSGLSWPSDTVRVSSVSGEGVESLIAAIDKRLSDGRPSENSPLLLSERQLRVARAIVEAIAGGHAVNALWNELLLARDA